MLSLRLSSVAVPSRCVHVAEGSGRRAKLGSTCVSLQELAMRPNSLSQAYKRTYYAGIASRVSVSRSLASKEKKNESNTISDFLEENDSLADIGQGKALRNAKNVSKEAGEEHLSAEEQMANEFRAQLEENGEIVMVPEVLEEFEGERSVEPDYEPYEAEEYDLTAGTPDDEELKPIRELAYNEKRYERSRHYHIRDKQRVMEKRKLRDERIHEAYMDAHGVPLEEKDGLVGLAEAAARALPDDESEIESARRKALKEAHHGREPRNRNPQPPGGRHERVDPKVDANDALWPDRHVNLHLEFPNATRPNDPKLKHFWLKDNLEITGAPELEGGAEMINLPDDIADPNATTGASSGKKSLGQKRREKREMKEALLPDWAKDSVAVEDLTVHKAIHGSGKSRHKPTGFRVDQHGRRIKIDNIENLDEKNELGVSWRDLGVSDDLIRTLKEKWHITTPTEIQELSLLEFVKGTNLLIADQTGTGKTLSYLLPMLERMAQFNKKNEYYKTRGQRTRSLIILPNRELVNQTVNVLQALLAGDARFANYKLLGMYGGGESIKRERHNLNDGLDILVSTPDRVLLHVEHEHLYLDDTTIVIFDEADTLLSSKRSSEDTESFMNQIRSVIEKQKVTHAKHVQFVSASATVSPPLMEFLKKEFGQSLTSIVGSGIHKSAESLRQDFLFGASGDFKKRLLFSTLKKHPGKRTIIFCNTQAQVKGVNTILEKSGYNAVAMTSDMPPKIRAKHFARFVEKEVPILVSTDLASRGLDMGATVEHVILYDFPHNTIDYLHRIGRTARAGAAGVVTAFLGKGDQALAGTIRDHLAEGKSLASIKPRKPDLKHIREIERKVPKRLPKHIRPENMMSSADML